MQVVGQGASEASSLTIPLGARNRIDKKWCIRYKDRSKKIYFKIGNIVVFPVCAVNIPCGLTSSREVTRDQFIRSTHTDMDLQNIIIINGNEFSFEPGESILDIARRNYIDIPTLCHLKEATPTGACRV